MAGSKSDITALAGEVDRLGMAIFGDLLISAELCPAGLEGFSGRQALVVGNLGGSMWTPFSASTEHSDGKPDAMDRWTRRVLTQLVGDLNIPGTDVIFPFDRPYWPFQRLLSAATGMKQSPLGLYIHPTYGLWQALRGAFVLPEGVIADLSGVVTLEPATSHPCDSCETKPCLSACPVDAFENGLDVTRCFPHLDSGEDPVCMRDGCAARNACPEGREFVYGEEQLRFHMASYRGP